MIQTLDSYLARTIRQWGGLYVVAVLIMIAASLYTLSVSFWRGPFRDMWEAMTFIEKAYAGEAVLADYWEQYGFSHRPLISRWLWVADYRWFSGSNHLLLTVSLSMQFCIAWGVWRVIVRDALGDVWSRIVLLTGMSLCLLTVTQVFNLLHTFDVQWFLTAAAVVWATERLVAGMTTHKNNYLVSAWLFVLLASWNNFSGLVIWPVQILLLYRMGYSVRQQFSYGLATSLYLVLYFYDLPTGSGELLQSVIESGSCLQWVNAISMMVIVFPVWYLSNPFSFQFAAEGPQNITWPLTWLAPVLAGLVLVWVAFIAISVIFRKKSLGGIGWMGLQLALFGYGVAVVTSLGRGLFWDNVYALRYQNIVMVFWIGVILLLVALLKHRAIALFSGALLLMVFLGVHQGWYHNHTIKMGNRTRDAHLALAVGLERHLSAIQPTVSRSHLYEGTDYTLSHEAEFLRKIKAGPAADPDWQVPDFSTLRDQPDCAVDVASVDVHGTDDAYARLAVDFVQSVDYRLIAWFDGDNVKPGLLIATHADTFLARLSESVYGVRHYAGFAQSLPQRAPESVFAVSGNSWCHLHIPELNRNEAGSP